MSTVNANQVKRIKVMVSERAKECGIIPSVAQEKFKKLVADFYEVETISTKEILAEDYEYLCSLIPLEFVKNEVKKDPFAVLSSIQIPDNFIESIPPSKYNEDKKANKWADWLDLSLEQRRNYCRGIGKKDIAYVSWASAFEIAKNSYPDLSYQVKFFDGLPFLNTKQGAMVFTSITINNVTNEMWLPIMDSSHNAMKDEPYSFKKGKYDTSVAAFTMFDVNKTIMRCLAKNLAMFGLGLYIYRGEDIPTQIEQEIVLEKQPQEVQLITPEQAAFLRNEIISFAQKNFPNEDPKTIGKMVVSYLGVSAISDLTASGFDSIARALLIILQNATATLKPELLSVEQLNQLENMLTDFSAATSSPLSEIKSMVLEKLSLKSFSDIKSNDFEEVKDLIESLFEEK